MNKLSSRRAGCHPDEGGICPVLLPALEGKVNKRIVIKQVPPSSGRQLRLNDSTIINNTTYSIQMKIPGHHSYYIYIVTNKNKTVLYTGVTNDLRRRLWEHEQNSIPFRSPSFAGKYNAYFLIYYECFDFIQNAIAREKEIKGWRRSKKEDLVKTMNPDWRFLNDEI